MTVIHIIILLVTGLGVGFLSGLLGIGGGFIMTPVQHGVYTTMGTPDDAAIKLAFGTSLLVILPTAISGVWRLNRRGLVHWRAGIIMGLSGMLASFAGARLSTFLPGDALKIVFGVFALTSAVRMLTARLPVVEPAPRDKPLMLFALAIPVGLLVGLLGVGGGIISIPVLTLVVRLSVHSAAATSLAIMALSTIGGVSGYAVFGQGISGLPPHSFGYIHLPSWLVLTVASVVMAQVGAIVAPRVPGQRLFYIFIAILFYVGLRWLGLFEWLGLPL